MHEQRFYHELIGPTVRLLARAAENVCIEPEFNDVISLANQAAFAAYHFREPILRESSTDRIGAMKDPSAENLRQKLSDVVDSFKHGRLKNSDRDVNLRAAIAFEFDHNRGFRFMRTEVMATNRRWGVFEVSDTILGFIKHLGKELDVNLTTEIRLPTYPFSEWAETYLTQKSGFSITRTGIHIYNRDANGALTPFSPPEVKFRVLQY